VHSAAVQYRQRGCEPPRRAAERVFCAKLLHKARKGGISVTSPTLRVTGRHWHVPINIPFRYLVYNCGKDECRDKWGDAGDPVTKTDVLSDVTACS